MNEIRRATEKAQALFGANTWAERRASYMLMPGQHSHYLAIRYADGSDKFLGTGMSFKDAFANAKERVGNGTVPLTKAASVGVGDA